MANRLVQTVEYGAEVKMNKGVTCADMGRALRHIVGSEKSSCVVRYSV